MGQREYARHRGVDHKAVAAAIRTGRISTLPDGKIDPISADREWEANTHPGYQPPRGEGDGAADRAKTGFAVLRVAKAKEELEALRIDNAKKRGELIDAGEARIAISNSARIFREAILNIPDRRGHEIAAELGVDTRAVAAVLDRILRETLIEVADTPLTIG
jgi:hypothetical protein